MGIQGRTEELAKFDVEAARADALKAIDTGEPEYAAVEVSRLLGRALDEIDRLRKGDEEIAKLVRKEVATLAESGGFVINVSIGGMNAEDPDFLAKVREVIAAVNGAPVPL